MRVDLYHFVPFALAHGGQQIQIVRTRDSLKQIGVEAEFLDWHRDAAPADILHYFGRIPAVLLELAHQKGVRVVVSDLLGAQGARPYWRLSLERLARRGAEAMLPSRSLGWAAYQGADACIALTSWEAMLLREQFGVSSKRIHVVPNAVDDVFLGGPGTHEMDWLVCVATIAPVKRVLELAEAAVLAGVPIRFVGKPYAANHPYAREFAEFIRNHRDLLTWDGPVEDRAALAAVYRQARGLVLVSRWESLSLAALEAAGCGCPLLLCDLPWAHAAFGDTAIYCPAAASSQILAAHLRAFHQHATAAPRPKPPCTWRQVAEQLLAVYSNI